MKNLLILLLLFSSIIAWTEPKREPPAKSTNLISEKASSLKTSKFKFSDEMLEGNRIDLRYTGYQATEVIAAIEKNTRIKKGEFESTAEYTARRDSILKTKFLDNSNLDDIYGFIVPVSKLAEYSDGIRYKYDVDIGTLKLYVLPSSSKYTPLNGVGGPEYDINKPEIQMLDQFKLSTKVDSKRSYMASNAFGATIPVEEISMSRAGLAVNPINHLNFERDIIYSTPTVAAEVRMDRSKAAAELPLMKALIVMKLTSPYIVYNATHKKPKRDSPSDIFVQEKFLTGDVIDIIYYSGRTGEVFARVSEKHVNSRQEIAGKSLGSLQEEVEKSEAQAEIDNPYQSSAAKLCRHRKKMLSEIPLNDREKLLEYYKKECDDIPH